MKLLFEATAKMLCGVIMLGAALFLPAGTFDFPGAWLFLGLLFVPMLALGAVMYANAPELLAKRLNGKEKEKTQRGVVAASGLIFISVFVLAGLDRRFGWSHMPPYLTCVGSILQLAGYGLYMEVMRENAYLSRTIEVQAGQKVIDTGLYGIVRHPMYAATVLMFLAMPVVLGSWAALCVMAAYPFIIAVRILNEEKVLEAGLDGYIDYKKRVRFRLIPYIW